MIATQRGSNTRQSGVRLRAFSFGAGTQSTALMVMVKNNPEILTNAGLELPGKAYLADTGAEGVTVYRHLEKLVAWGLPIPLEIVKHELGITSNHGMRQIPHFLLNPDGTKGQTLRSCTDRYKIQPLEKAMRRDAGYRKGQRGEPGSITLWLGISTDEASRQKPNPSKTFTNLFPLLEIGWSRRDCIDYVEAQIGWTPPKSRCVHCPYIAPSDWEHIQARAPEDWAQAVELDARMRTMGLGLRGTPFIHVNRLPLPEAVALWRYRRDTKTALLGSALFEMDQMDNECTGTCGL